MYISESQDSVPRVLNLGTCFVNEYDVKFYSELQTGSRVRRFDNRLTVNERSSELWTEGEPKIIK